MLDINLLASSIWQAKVSHPEVHQSTLTSNYTFSRLNITKKHNVL